MKQTRRTTTLQRLFFAIVLSALTFAGFSSLMAQPTNYCQPYPKTDYSYNYCWPYHYITEVKITQVSNGTVILDRTSGQEGCYIPTGVTGNMKLGQTYSIRITSYCPYYYYQTVRLFIDWNHNGSFADAGEFIGNSSTVYYGSGTFTTTKTVTVGCSQDPGVPTMMRVLTTYYYDNGSDACANGYVYAPYYNYCYGEAEDYILNFVADIESTFPPAGGILQTATAYDGSSPSYPKPSVTMGSTQPSGAILTYQIIGPRPSSNVIYEGLNVSNNSPNIDMGGYKTYTMQSARYSAAINNGDGSVQFSRGGEYKVAASISGSGCPGYIYNVFTASWPNDIAAQDASSPKNNSAPRYFKYLRGQTIKVTGLFQNVGLNDVTEFMGYAYILTMQGDTIYRAQYHFDSFNNPSDQVMRPSDKREIDFPTVKFNNVGTYKVVFVASLMNANDDESYNNVFPRSDDPAYVFEIAYEIQLAANRFIRPQQGDVLVGNRPVIPTGEFKNVGVGDASDVPAQIRVWKLPITSTSTPAYQSNKIVLDVPAGKYNLKVEDFDVMTLKESGTYMAELIITHPDDVLRDDDTTRITFTVDGGLTGSYTVGSTYAGNSNNFPTIDSAMNALYYKGLAGPVTFQLTDDTYHVYGKTPTQPAWDFSTYIINLGYDADKNRYNTITWQPSLQRSLSRASITIYLHSPNGKGIVFGQSMNPSNTYSVYNQYWNIGSLARKYANSPGYITFDGGSQKSFKFNLISASKSTGAAFYLQRGSTNITVKNCIIENGTPSIANNIWLPMTAYSPVSGFSFQPDTLVSGPNVFGYSAGIVTRATLMGDDANRLRIDTIPNSNCLINSNEIYGFGYGFVSLGYGQVLMENLGDYKRFYNINNEYSNNLIYNCYRAGMYIGYEENSKILNNRIFNIGNSSIAAAGLMIGGDMTKDFKGYNNINLTINGNEISAITSGVDVAGIAIKQSRNVFPHPSKTQVFYPDIPETMTLTNNVVWGLTTTAAAANRFGIHLFTDRTTTGGTNWATLKTPFYADYMSRNDRLVNNTIIIGNNGGLISTGACAGIAVQQGSGTYLRNNAIALTDIGVDNSAPAYGAIFYQGYASNAGGINSDRNVFWVGSGATGGIARYIEVDNLNRNIDENDRDAFKTMTQWRTWTHQDGSSVLGNFINDLTYLGNEPNQRLRVITTPQTPLSSYLNNRGERISWLTTDIDGNPRGQAGQRYDVGASEFTGRMYITDMEMLDITSPAAYKAVTGTYSDAEYIMTKAPVEIKATVRNNGNIQQSGISVTVAAYRELANGTFSTSPEITKTVQVSAPSTETIEAVFGLGNDLQTGWTPKTYALLPNQGYVVPDQFVSMKANVTPRYKIVASLNSDQQNANNSTSKIVRFYILKSSMRILLSVESSMITLDANSTQDQIAGRLNYDSLRVGLKKLGWIVNADSSRFDYDVFDRLGWEPRAVNYSNYRTAIWADGADKPLTRLQRMDMTNYLSFGNQTEKKNLIIGSQGYVRQNSLPTIEQDSTFLQNYFRAISIAPENPLGVGGNNDGNWVVGMANERSLVEKIAATKYVGDQAPNCGLMKISPTGEGLAQASYYYWNRATGVRDSIMGVSTSTLNRNVLMFGVDWRHWTNISMLVRGFIDYIEKNGGTIIPVELLSFDAQAAGDRVNINWTTASEYNSDRFEIERATVNQSGKSAFAKIGDMKAAGTSNQVLNYGPVVDRNVEFGTKYAYRLKMVDLTGEWRYSNEVEVTIGEAGTWLGSVVPNPATVEGRFDYTIATDANVTIALYDITGKKVTDVYNGPRAAGSYTATVTTGDITNGVYTIVMTVNGISYTRQINVAK